MVVNADKEMLFQSCDSGALNAIAFEHNGGFEFAVHSIDLLDGIGERKRTIDGGNTVVEHDFDLLAELTQHFAAGEY
jgi:hypothetical protein